MAEPAAPTRTNLRSAGVTLAALLLIELVVFMDRNALAAALVPVKERFGLSDAAAGLLLTVFTVSFCLTLPIVGWLSDQMPRKYLLAVGIGIWSMTTLATGLAQTYEQMLIARSLTGIGEATCAPIGPTLIADCFPRRLRSRALAVLFIAIPIGSALGLGVGGLAAAWLDWRLAFYLTAALGVLAAGLALAIDEPRRGIQDLDETELHLHASYAWRDGLALWHNRSFVFTTGGMALMVFGLIGLNAWAPTLLMTVHQFSAAEAGAALGIIVGAAGIGGAALGGWLGDRLLPRGVGALLWLVGATTLAAVPCLAAVLFVTNPVALFACLALGLALIFMNVGPLDTVLIHVTAPKVRGAAFAFNVLAIHLIGEMPSPLVLGAVSDATGSLLWGLGLATASLSFSGLVYCLAGRFLPMAAQPDHEIRAGEPAEQRAA